MFGSFVQMRKKSLVLNDTWILLQRKKEKTQKESFIIGKNFPFGRRVKVSF